MVSSGDEMAAGEASAGDSPRLEPPLRPISFLVTVLLFAVPAAITSFSLLVVLPALMRRGFSLFAVFNLTFLPPLALMLIAAFAGLKVEGRSLTWPVIRDRLRLGRMPRHGWWWVLGLCLFNVLAGVVGSPLLRHTPASLHLYTWPKEFAAFMQAFGNTGKEFLGIPLPGHWWVFFYFVSVLIVFNMFGEELWWRGFILPRQELGQGRWTWVIHGALWDMFHIFYHQTAWTFLAFLPGMLAIAYVCQRLKNTWPGIISHTVANSGIPIAILFGILR
jgi:membrane protease YdiL (CAAX protease family)